MARLSFEKPGLRGYLAPSDSRRSCKNCGCAMKPVGETATEIEAVHTPALNKNIYHTKAIRIKGYGYAAEGLFCTLTCAYAWAKTQLRPSTTDPAPLTCGAPT